MADLQDLQKISNENLAELLDFTLKNISQKTQSTDLPEQYKVFCKKSNIEISELESTVQVLLQVCKDAVKKGKPLTQLLDELRKLGLKEEQTEIFSKQWEKLCSSLMQSTADIIPINPLVDMEWKFGVTSASSQLNTVGNVFLQMKLEVDQGNGRTKTVCFELQLSEFYAFLHEMERARASLDYLS